MGPPFNEMFSGWKKKRNSRREFHFSQILFLVLVIYRRSVYTFFLAVVGNDLRRSFFLENAKGKLRPPRLYRFVGVRCGHGFSVKCSTVYICHHLSNKHPKCANMHVS